MRTELLTDRIISAAEFHIKYVYSGLVDDLKHKGGIIPQSGLSVGLGLPAGKNFARVGGHWTIYSAYRANIQVPDAFSNVKMVKNALAAGASPRTLLGGLLGVYTVDRPVGPTSRT